MKKVTVLLMAALVLTMSACSIKIVIEKDGTEESTGKAESTEAAGTKVSGPGEMSAETKSTEGKSTETKSAETKSAETKSAEESGASKETEVPDIHSEDASVKNLHLLRYAGDYVATRTEDGTVETICKAAWAGYGLVEEEVPLYNDLARVLDSARDKKKADCKTAFYQICSEPYTDMFDNVLTSVIRADSRAVSILTEHSYWYGGDWHLGKSGLNLDSVTGEAIALKDAVTDFSALEKRLEEKLTDKYGAEFTGNNFLKEGNYFGEAASCTFTLGYEGLTVYFNEGLQETSWMSATIYYGEAPEIFNSCYAKAAENYVIPFDEAEFAEADVDGDGKREVITVNGTVNGDYVEWISGPAPWPVTRNALSA